MRLIITPSINYGDDNQQHTIGSKAARNIGFKFSYISSDNVACAEAPSLLYAASPAPCQPSRLEIADRLPDQPEQ